jgi:hypothetical protein
MAARVALQCARALPCASARRHWNSFRSRENILSDGSAAASYGRSLNRARASVFESAWGVSVDPQVPPVSLPRAHRRAIRGKFLQLTMVRLIVCGKPRLAAGSA